MKRSLNFKLLAWAACSIFVVSFALTFHGAKKSYHQLLNSSTLNSKGYADDIARDIEIKILKVFEVTRSFARTLSQMKDPNNPVKYTRDDVFRMMEVQFKANPTIFGFNTCWEPNAFDGQDSQFVNKFPSDGSGRMIPYMTRKADGSAKIEPLVDYDKEGAGDYYLVPKKMKSDVVSAPYSYPVDGRNVLMVTLSSPIMFKDQFYGATGSDVDLTFFQQLVDQKNDLPEGSRIAIFDGSGAIVGFTGHSDLLLKNIFSEKIEGYENFDKSRLAKAENSNVLGEKNLSVLADIDLEGTKWYIEVLIPKAAITQPIYSEIFQQILLSVVFAFAALLVGYFLVKKITSQIISLSNRLKESAEVTRSGSKTVKEVANKVSSANQEQMAAIQETAVTLEEISAMVTKSVDNAKASSDQANQSYNIAEEGMEAIRQMLQAIDGIKEGNARIVEQIEQGNKEIASIIKVIQDISEKTRVINDIVFQTKLLSFNASVEAARAGESGKGFAVVAEEVGTLASMSGKSSKEINDLLESSIVNVEKIIHGTRERVEALAQEGLGRVEEGVQVAQRCEELLSQIVQNVSSVKNMMGDVSYAAEEQSKGVKNISDAMNMLDSSTQSNATTVEESAMQSDKLYRAADSLNEIIQLLEEEVYGKKAS